MVGDGVWVGMGVSVGLDVRVSVGSGVGVSVSRGTGVFVGSAKVFVGSGVAALKLQASIARHSSPKRMAILK
jgi:hypothetical protein